MTLKALAGERGNMKAVEAIDAIEPRFERRFIVDANAKVE